MRLLTVFIACFGPTGFAQPNAPVVVQGTCNATNTAKGGTVTVTCFNVDKKLADQIIQLVEMSKRDEKMLKEISGKLDTVKKELEKPTTNLTSVNQQAPYGINIGPGATAPNAQVNNFGPPPANITFTEDVTAPLPTSGDGEKVMTVHLKTDRSIPGAIIGLILSGPVTMTQEYWSAHSPTITPSGAYEVDIVASLNSSGTPIPNSMALKVILPSAFSPGQDLAVTVASKVDVHVIEVGDITSKFR
jgi:hypothetical protein